MDGLKTMRGGGRSVVEVSYAPDSGTFTSSSPRQLPDEVKGKEIVLLIPVHKDNTMFLMMGNAVYNSATARTDMGYNSETAIWTSSANRNMSDKTYGYKIIAF